VTGDPETAGVSEELLVEVVDRASLFALLREGPHETTEVTEQLDVSRSTVHRATESLSEQGLLRNGDGGLELTGLGRVVAERLADFRAEMAGATRLQPFLNTAEPTDVDVPVSKFDDATVVHPKPRQPHFAVKRLIELVEAADSVRLFTSVISPFYVNVFYREMLDGTEVEAVFDPEVLDIVSAEYADRAGEAAETGRFDILVREGVPFELFVFDDRIGIAAHDEDGIARVFVEAEARQAVEWATDLYESFREQADRFDTSAL
jgi:predicted transcriptional regulator